MSEQYPVPVAAAPVVETHASVEPGSVIAADSGVVLRYVRDSDAPAIIDLIAAIWAEYPSKILNAPADMPELLAPRTAYARADGQFWVIEAHGDIIGTVALKPNAHDAGIVELQKMYVAHSMRRNGLGTFLCSLVEREARDRGSRAVEHNRRHQIAQRAPPLPALRGLCAAPSCALSPTPRTRSNTTTAWSSNGCRQATHRCPRTRRGRC